jgi:hypothetical protein
MIEDRCWFCSVRYTIGGIAIEHITTDFTRLTYDKKRKIYGNKKKGKSATKVLYMCGRCGAILKDDVLERQHFGME